MLLGIWKNYEELEDSVSLPELTSILVAKHDKDQQNRKFLAALQGVDLDKETGSSETKGQKEWEDLKARVFSKGQVTDSSDVASLQGVSAQQAGFGVGMGIDYQVVKDKKNPKNPMSG
jgi:hypothetical protein